MSKDNYWSYDYKLLYNGEVVPIPVKKYHCCESNCKCDQNCNCNCKANNCNNTNCNCNCNNNCNKKPGPKPEPVDCVIAEPIVPSTPDFLPTNEEREVRAKSAKCLREKVAQLAFQRPRQPLSVNSEELLYVDRCGDPTFVAKFTKGLPHNIDGYLENRQDYLKFRDAIWRGRDQDWTQVPIGPRIFNQGSAQNPPANPEFLTTKLAGIEFPEPGANSANSVRKWESPMAGLVYDLQGPDAGALSIPPYPEFSSPELQAEQAELYVAALLRDVPFSQLDEHPDAKKLTAILNNMPWFSGAHITGLTPEERARRRGPFPKPSQLFRGVFKGDNQGPWLSQFMFRGTPVRGSLENRVPVFVRPGEAATRAQKCSLAPPDHVRYGAISIDLKVQVAEPKYDFMTRWPSFLDVQNGANFGGYDRLEQRFRLALTLRDMATYVHFDQLYEAYLNAAFFLLESKFPFDRNMPLGSEPTQAGFATFGGPHLLALLTEVSSRALKAVRFAKFNVHRRLRPEAVGGLVDAFDREQGSHTLAAPVQPVYDALKPLEEHIKNHNERVNVEQASDYFVSEKASEQLCSRDRFRSMLLPMAFPEGSPMHPAYGAGHATVAGACVTILKAWFDTDVCFAKAFDVFPCGEGRSELREVACESLTLEGELNKLAANISNSRNLAGVHYFTDYYESVLLGEQVAIGILEEQAQTYREKGGFPVTLKTFKGEEISFSYKLD